MQGGGRVGLLRIHRQRQVTGIDRQPGLDGGEAGVGLIRMPGHGRTGAVAAQGLGPVGDGLGIDQPLERHLGLGQAQLLALIDEDIAAQADQQHQGHLGEGLAVPPLRPA